MGRVGDETTEELRRRVDELERAQAADRERVERLEGLLRAVGAALAEAAGPSVDR